MIRLGLCCIFRKQPIKFRRTTATYLLGLPIRDRLDYLSRLCLENARSLLRALQFCLQTGIGDFRINSQILPLKTHPEAGYDVNDLPDGHQIVNTFRTCGRFSRKNDIRTTFHPDQFILLSSASDEVTRRSLADLYYHAEVAEWVHADVINIHGGGAYGNKTDALERVRRRILDLPESVRSRLTLENDDRTYTPADLLPVCRDTGIGFVYDVHHHRCLPDGRSVEETTRSALKTWNREPLFHVSSPKLGWNRGNVRNHHDYIDITDVPKCWLDLNITVEVEAKAKELAILKLKNELKHLPG